MKDIPLFILFLCLINVLGINLRNDWKISTENVDVDYDDFEIDVSNVTILEGYNDYVYYAKGTIRIYSSYLHDRYFYCGFTEYGPTDDNVKKFISHVNNTNFIQGTDDDSVNYFTCGVKYNESFYFENINVGNTVNVLMICVILVSILLVITLCVICYGCYSSKIATRSRTPSHINTVEYQNPISSTGIYVNANTINYIPIHVVKQNEELIPPTN